MKGLMKSYFLEMRQNLKFTIITLFFITVINFIENNHYISLMILTTTFSTLYLSVYSKLSSSKYERVIPLPIRDVIFSKYLYLSIMLVFGIMLSTIYLTFYYVMNGELNRYLVNSILLSTGIVISIATYYFPFYTKSRSRKIKYFNFLIFILPALHLYFYTRIEDYLLEIGIVKIIPWSGYVISCLVLYVISCFIMLFLSKKK